MSDYGRIYADWAIFMLYSHYHAIGVPIVAKGTATMVPDAPIQTSAAPSTPEANGQVVAATLPSGFRRFADLRKRAPKATYDDLREWVGKTIRLDGINFDTKMEGEKRIFVSGTMTFSEFNPENPDQETEQAISTAIPRGALRALYEGLTKNPDETIICEVVQTKRGLALQ